MIDEVRLLPEDHKAKVEKLEVDFILIIIKKCLKRNKRKSREIEK